MKNPFNKLFNDIIESNNLIPELVIPEIKLQLKFECKAANSNSTIIGLDITNEKAYCRVYTNDIKHYQWFTYQSIINGFKCGEYTLTE